MLPTIIHPSSAMMIGTIFKSYSPRYSVNTTSQGAATKLSHIGEYSPSSIFRHYYATPLSMVQITSETSTNVPRYLYLSQSLRARVTKKSIILMLDIKSLIRRLVCVVSREIFTRLLHFESPWPTGSPKYSVTRKNIP